MVDMGDLKVQSQSLTSSYALEQMTKIDEVCQEYGLYGRIINYKNEKSVLGSGIYYVIGVEPIDDDVNPYQIEKRGIRDCNLFYPKEFAVKLTDQNLMVAFDKVMKYCKNAEFLSRLYGEYKTKLPECIRYSELSGLKNWCDGRDNIDASDMFREKCVKGLRTFFKNENSSFGQEKRRFFRSERYDENAGFLERKSDYANRDSSIVRLPVILQGTKDIGKMKMRKHEYENFVRYMKNVYPEVLYSVSEKEVVDLGLIEATKHLPNDHPLVSQRPVTDEEFHRVIKERFAKEGFECTNNIKPTYWEFYDVYYKKIDEPQVIAAYNDISLAFADHETLDTIRSRGPVNLIDISVNDIHQFVALAKEKHLQFHIDHRGRCSIPSFEELHIVYSSRDKEIMDEIVNEMVSNDISNSHLVPQKVNWGPVLEEKIQEARVGLAPYEKREKSESRGNERF